MFDIEKLMEKIRKNYGDYVAEEIFEPILTEIVHVHKELHDLKQAIENRDEMLRREYERLPR